MGRKKLTPFPPTGSNLVGDKRNVLAFGRTLKDKIPKMLSQKFVFKSKSLFSPPNKKSVCFENKSPGRRRDEKDSKS